MEKMTQIENTLTTLITINIFSLSGTRKGIAQFTQAFVNKRDGSDIILLDFQKLLPLSRQSLLK